MAEEIPPPPASTSQLSNPVSPTIDYYEKIVERAHKEIEWVRGKYKIAATILGVISGLTIGAATFLSYSTMHDQQTAISDISAYSGDCCHLIQCKAATHTRRKLVLGHFM